MSARTIPLAPQDHWKADSSETKRWQRHVSDILLNGETSYTIAADTHNLDVNLGQEWTLFLNVTAVASLTGLVAKGPNHRARICNVGTETLTLPAESASSTGVNRFAHATSVKPTASVIIYRDSRTKGSERWRVIGGG